MAFINATLSVVDEKKIFYKYKIEFLFNLFQLRENHSTMQECVQLYCTFRFA